MTGTQLRRWRLKAKMTQKELAKKLKVSEACISRWERGNRPVNRFLTMAKLREVKP
jgi:transcriptional regulator with XRE-family HTH domain